MSGFLIQHCIIIRALHSEKLFTKLLMFFKFYPSYRVSIVHIKKVYKKVYFSPVLTSRTACVSFVRVHNTRCETPSLVKTKRRNFASCFARGYDASSWHRRVGAEVWDYLFSNSDFEGNVSCFWKQLLRWSGRWSFSDRRQREIIIVPRKGKLLKRSMIGRWLRCYRRRPDHDHLFLFPSAAGNPALLSGTLRTSIIDLFLFKSFVCQLVFFSVLQVWILPSSADVSGAKGCTNSTFWCNVTRAPNFITSRAWSRPSHVCLRKRVSTDGKLFVQSLSKPTMSPLLHPHDLLPKRFSRPATANTEYHTLAFINMAIITSVGRQ